MGYYTSHELEIISNNDNSIDYEKEISEESDYQDCFEESIKWYEHEKDMRKYSLKHPETVFKLSGEGEESGDLWQEYYKDGLMQRCNALIQYPDFDKNLLD